jgi:hypothetical protein
MFDQLGEPLSEQETKQVIEEIAGLVVKRGLITPAIMFLEMHKPLSFVAGQGLIVAMPFLAPFLGADKVGRYSRFLNTRENIERLIQRIEDMSEEKDREEREERKKRKNKSTGQEDSP